MPWPHQPIALELLALHHLVNVWSVPCRDHLISVAMSEITTPDDDSWPLTEVEPSPIEDTPVEVRDSYFPPPKDEAPAPLSKRITSLGLTSHGPPYYRK